MTACFVSLYFSPIGLSPIAAQTLLSIKQRPPHDNLQKGTFYLRIFSRHDPLVSIEDYITLVCL